MDRRYFGKVRIYVRLLTVPMFQAPSITDCGPKVIMALRMVALR